MLVGWHGLSGARAARAGRLQPAERSPSACTERVARLAAELTALESELAPA